MIRAALETPLGEMIAIADEKALHLLEFSNRKNLARQIARLPQDIKRGTNPIIKALSHELALYFEGRLKNFKTPLVLHGS
ncbi:MAG: bifunctional transcriptional activator/DNA repair enzyme protein Ada, partial [Pseudomonadota bacterium]|nr:bifunctional transcriptional activator/DNA repair enzyme protein Ada [Pseudomonadota bacterium]